MSKTSGDYWFAWVAMIGGKTVYLGETGFKRKAGIVYKRMGGCGSMRGSWKIFNGIKSTLSWKSRFQDETRLFYLDCPGGKKGSGIKEVRV